jgi:hypothetical protein
MTEKGRRDCALFYKNPIGMGENKRFQSFKCALLLKAQELGGFCY